jgi:hypothetical protein
MARLSTVKPSQSTLTLIASGRGVIGPVNVGRAVRMWRAFQVSAHLCPAGSKSWEVVQQDADGTDTGVVWQYTIPANGAPMLWQRDAETITL